MSLPKLEPGDALTAASVNNAFDGVLADLNAIGKRDIRDRSLSADVVEGQVLGYNVAEIPGTITHTYTDPFARPAPSTAVINTLGSAGGGTVLEVDLGQVFTPGSADVSAILIDAEFFLFKSEAYISLMYSQDGISWTQTTTFEVWSSDSHRYYDGSIPGYVTAPTNEWMSFTQIYRTTIGFRYLRAYCMKYSSTADDVVLRGCRLSALVLRGTR